MDDTYNGSDVLVSAVPTLLSLASASKTFYGISVSPAFITFVVGVVLFMLPFTNHRFRDCQSGKIPGGPRGLPIVGSFPFLTKYPELTLDRWARKYGYLYSIWLGNQLFMIISDPNIAKDLLVTNGNVFSSRKEMYFKSQTVFAGRGITATPYNDRWRKHRRIASAWLSQKAVDTYSPILDRESKSLIKALYEGSQGGLLPINPQPHAGRCSLNNMTTITFGFRTDTIKHPFVKQALQLSREFMDCTGPMSNLVDFIPLLQRTPSALHKRGKRLHRGLVEIYGGQIKRIEEDLASGKEVPDCLGKTMVEDRHKEDLDDLGLAILASAFMIGGVETTAAIMQWFSALIPASPEVQRKAQVELDQVVGRGRLPSIEDEKNLPYCHAIIKEDERVHNPFWLGTPHVASEDFTYKGKYIPKDTVLVLNTWTMHHDPDRYPNPEKFAPERYINDHLTSAESANVANPEKRDHWMFGAGRRICPGMIVAEREIWLTISRMLWAFNMSEMPEEPIDLTEYDGLSGRSPVPFRVRFTPRHENVAKILKDIEI